MQSEKNYAKIKELILAELYRNIGRWEESLAWLNKVPLTENATPEGHSVWMIVHTNLCERYDESITWYNVVKGDRIEEIWNGSHNELLFLDVSRRITFVRERSDSKPVYKFLGVYELVGAEIREVYGKKRTGGRYNDACDGGSQ